MAIGWNETGGSLPFGPKPSQPEINWREPLTRGLVFATDYSFSIAANTGTHFDLTKNAAGIFSGAPTPALGPFGQQITFPNGTPGGVDTYTTLSAVNGLTKATVEFIAKPNINDFGCFLSKGADQGANGCFLNIGWVQGEVYIDVGFSGGNAEWQTNTGLTAYPNDQFRHCVVTYDSGSNSNVPAVYVNGKVVTPMLTNDAPSGTRVSDSNVLLVANYNGGGADMFPDIVYMRYWNRILSAQEIRSLAGNPWQIYRGPAPLAAANLGGNASGLTAARGLFGETGEAATLKCGRALIAARGSFGEAGQAAVLKYGRSVGAARGVFVVTGEAASLLRGKGVAAAHGSFAEAGWAASFSLSRKIVAACGSIAVGGEPAMFRGGTTVIWSPVRPGAEAWTIAAPDTQTWTQQTVSPTSWTVE